MPDGDPNAPLDAQMGDGSDRASSAQTTDGIGSQPIAHLRLHLMLAEYEPMLRLLLEARIPSRARSLISVEDVLQQTWLAAFHAADNTQWPSRRDFEKWLLRVVQSQLRLLLRSFYAQKRGQGLQTARSGTSVMQSLPASVRTPSSFAAAQETFKTICQAIAALPSLPGEILRLRYIDGLTLRQIAKRKGMTPAAVDGRIRRALHKIRRQMAS